MAGALFVISGPAGAGKGTLLGRAVQQLPRAWVSVSATTRAPRGTEQDGVEYFFLKVEDFEQRIAQDGFIEYAQVHGNYYGTPLEPIRQHVEAGDAVFLEIDVQGAFQVLQKVPDAKLIFIAPPSMEVLEQRLRGRATDSEDSIRLRLANAAAELEASKRYDHVIVNDELERSTQELVQVIQSYVGY
ncbi:MAG: guanylate kinase [Coriobacteriales bacterium]